MLGLEDLGRAADGGASVAWAEERGGLTHMDAHTRPPCAVVRQPGLPGRTSVDTNLTFMPAFVLHRVKIYPSSFVFHFISPRLLALAIMQSAGLISFSN